MDLSPLYKAMADETRRRIVAVLAESSLNVQELQSIIGGAQSNVSHHLKVLERAGMVANQREGTKHYYSLNHDEDIPHQIVQNFLSFQSQLNGSGEVFLTDEEALQLVLDKRRDDAKNYFDEVAPRWSAIRDETVDSTSYLEELNALISKEGKLAELGCGSGALLKNLLPRTGESFGIDYSRAMLAEAEATLSDVDLRLGTLEHLPLGDDSIDTALMHMVLHHVPKPIEALKDAARVVKPGGKLLIVDLHEHHDETMRERYADLWLGFAPKQIVRWAKKSGFCEIETTSFSEAVFVMQMSKT